MFIIVNSYKRSSHLLPGAGEALKDCTETFYSRLGFCDVCHLAVDCDKKEFIRMRNIFLMETKEKIIKKRSSIALDKYYVAFVFNGHGAGEYLHNDTIGYEQNQHINLRFDVVEPFCDVLGKNVIKLFFLGACRSVDNPPREKEKLVIPDGESCCFVYSCLPYHTSKVGKSTKDSPSPYGLFLNQLLESLRELPCSLSGIASNVQLNISKKKESNESIQVITNGIVTPLVLYSSNKVHELRNDLQKEIKSYIKNLKNFKEKGKINAVS